MLGSAQGGKVNSVIQQRIDVVPHNRSEQMLAAVKQAETDKMKRHKTEGEEHTISETLPLATWNQQWFLSFLHELPRIQLRVLFKSALNQNSKAFFHNS